MLRSRIVAVALLMGAPLQSDAQSFAALSATPSAVLAEARRAQVELAATLALEHQGAPARLPAAYRLALRSAERLTGLLWSGPDPLVVLAGHFSNTVACDGGDCQARIESVRVRLDRDTVVASVVIVSAITLLDERVWRHELTHALLMQHGRAAESERHDPRWFPRALLAAR